MIPQMRPKSEAEILKFISLELVITLHALGCSTAELIEFREKETSSPGAVVTSQPKSPSDSGRERRSVKGRLCGLQIVAPTLRHKTLG
jgi:hypothetical protein